MTARRKMIHDRRRVLHKVYVAIERDSEEWLLHSVSESRTECMELLRKSPYLDMSLQAWWKAIGIKMYRIKRVVMLLATDYDANLINKGTKVPEFKIKNDTKTSGQDKFGRVVDKESA